MYVWPAMKVVVYGVRHESVARCVHETVAKRRVIFTSHDWTRKTSVTDRRISVSTRDMYGPFSIKTT